MNKRKKCLVAVAAFLIVIGFLLTYPWRHVPDIVVDGGHCVYDSAKIGARLLTMSVNSGNTLEEPVFVMVEVITKQKGIDTINLSRTYPYNMFTMQDWVNTGLKKGDLIKCTFQWQTEGNCVPYLYRFHLKIYTGSQP